MDNHDSQVLDRLHAIGRACLRIPGRCVIPVLWFGAILGTAQTLTTGQTQKIAPPPRTLQVRSVSAYFEYSTAALPNSGGSIPSTGTLGADATGGANVRIGWLKSTERSTYSFDYTSAITRRVQYSEWNTWNHNLILTATHKLAPRWRLGFSAVGELITQEQSLFSPTSLSNTAGVQATFDELSSGILASKFTNPQLTSVLIGPTLAESPVRYLLYGQRLLVSGAQTNLSYAYSPRLSVTFAVGGSRMQPLSTGGSPSGSGTGYLIGNTTSGNATLGFSYSRSPRTQLGGSVSVARTSSTLQEVYITTSLLTVGRTIGRRWFAQLQGGLGVAEPTRQSTFLRSTVAVPVAGGSLGVKTFTHTILGSFSHGASDQYGLGSSTNTTASAAWRWDRAARPWWVESVLSWQQLHGNGFSNTTGWRASTGLGRRIGTHFSVLMQYAYLEYSGDLRAVRYDGSQSAVRVSAIWYPGSALAR